MPEAPTKFYLTTPIYYVNARPHIGHAYSTIAADVLARRHRLLGEEVFFLTGTDEHGQKVQRSAAAAGIPPQQFTDEVSKSFQDLWARMGITNNDFIRTTEPRHKVGVQKLWRQLEASGDIYLDSYTGAYCVSCEAFVDLPAGTPCPDCGRPLEIVTEENYFFSLSAYQQKVIDLIESGTLHIQPDGVRNEVLSFLRGEVVNLVAQNLPAVENETFREMVDRATRALAEESDNPVVNRLINEKKLAQSNGKWYIPGALKDLSISRTTFDWGIPVPSSTSSSGAPFMPESHPGMSGKVNGSPAAKHVIYVWLDALANYITAIGYGAEDRTDLSPQQQEIESKKFKTFWPADIHLVGKEITRFHCVYWPAFLMAAGLDTPKSVVANGWLLFEESKMSKSRGNVVRTETILDAFGDHYRASIAAHNKKLATESSAAPPKSAVILSEAARQRGESKDPEGSDTATFARTVLPPVLLKGTASAVPQNAHEKRAALAAEVTSSLAVPEPDKRDCDLFAADVLRYFLLREIPFGQDGSFSFDALITRYNADLANGYGNLVSRTFSMIEKYFDGLCPSHVTSEGPPQGVASLPIFARYLDNLDFSRSLESTWSSAIGYIDHAITVFKPWTVAARGTETDRLALGNFLYSVAESIRHITALLYPVMPHTTAKVWAQLGLGNIEDAARAGELKDLQWGGLKPGTKLGPLAPIFPRAPKELAQVMTDMETTNNPPKAAESAAPAPATAAPAATATQPATPGNEQPAPSAQISIDDFAKVDLRVARVLVAERIPKADKLLRLEVDLGPNFDPPTRQVLAGIAEYYAPETLIGRKVVIVANLAPRKMRGLESQGMVVAAAVGPDGAPVLAGFLEDVEIGARLK